MAETDNAAPQVIILSDLVNRSLFFRYSAPYLLAHSLRSQGYKVTVIDWFTQLPEHGLNAVADLASSELKYVMFCSTFLMTRLHHPSDDEKHVLKDFNERNLDMTSDSLWFQSQSEMVDWFSRLKSKVQSKAPDAKILLGGGAAVRIMYFNPELADYIDLVVSGYGENAVTALMKNQVGDFPEYNGFKYWKVPADIQPFAAYPFTLSKEDNFQPEEAGILEFARGCRFRCKFCSYDIGRSDHLDENVFYEVLMTNYDNFGTTRYHLVDNCINDRLDKVKVLHSVSQRLPFELEWVSYVRPEMYSKNPEMIDLMAESGAGGLFYGIETLDEKAGQLCGKGGDKHKFMQLMLDIQSRYKDRIYTLGSFIVGLPRESEETVRQSMEWVLKEKPFHFSSFGSLVLQHPEFVAATKDLVFENNGYSIFSTNPEKYGLSFTKRYKFIGDWSHEHMNFARANELSKDYLEKAIKQTLVTQNGSFDYVSYRGSGFTREEIMRYVNHGTDAEKADFQSVVERKSLKLVSDYLEKYR